MPTYDYECKDCKNQFEVFQNIKDEPIKVCPQCKGSVRRIISAGTGIIFKGSGFYTTDYKKTNSVTSDKSDSAKAGSAKKDTTTESKTSTEKTEKSEKSDKPVATGTKTPEALAS